MFLFYFSNFLNDQSIKGNTLPFPWQFFQFYRTVLQVSMYNFLSVQIKWYMFFKYSESGIFTNQSWTITCDAYWPWELMRSCTWVSMAVICIFFGPNPWRSEMPPIRNSNSLWRGFPVKGRKKVWNMTTWLKNTTQKLLNKIASAVSYVWKIDRGFSSIGVAVPFQDAKGRCLLRDFLGGSRVIPLSARLNLDNTIFSFNYVSLGSYPSFMSFFYAVRWSTLWILCMNMQTVAFGKFVITSYANNQIS